MDRAAPLRSLLAPLALAGALLHLGSSPAAAQVTLPPDFQWVVVTDQLELPTQVVAAPDGSLYVAEKTGRVRRLEPAAGGAAPALQGAPVIDLADEVNQQGDRGLLGLALHPGFAPDGGPTSWIYLLYTASPVSGLDLVYDQLDLYSHSMLTRYRLNVGSGGAVEADPGTRQVLLGERLPDGRAPDAIASLHDSHSNGSLLFAPDGTLLVSTGDGAHWDQIDHGGLDAAGFDDVVNPLNGLRGQLDRTQDSGAHRARDVRSLAGKLLRIDPATGLGLPSNPHFDGDPASLASRVYAMGFRNPFRVARRPGTGASDPSLGDPGQLVVADVGYGWWEELSLIDAPGLDCGWPCFEGPVDLPPYATFERPDPNPFAWPDCSDPGPTRGPLLAYSHDVPEALFPSGVHLDADGFPAAGFEGGCVVGGVFLEPGPYPSAYDGDFVLADYGAGWVKRLQLDAAGALIAVRDFGTGLQRPSSFALDALTGELLVTELGGPAESGRLLRLRHGDNATPTPALVATPDFGPAPLEVTLDASASSDADGDPLVYRFDPGDGTPPVEGPDDTLVHTYGAQGSYDARLTVRDPEGAEATVGATVQVDLVPPTTTIDAPVSGSVVPVGETLLLSGSGAADDGGPLDFTWSVDLHHDDHVHPGFLVAGEAAAFTTSLELEVVAHGQPGDVFYYRVLLTGVAADGAHRTHEAWIYPEGQFSDPAARALPIAEVLELGGPDGPGNADLEVVRDAVEPSLGAAEASWISSRDLDDTLVDDRDWFGYRFVDPPDPDARLVALSFLEGAALADGGWFETLGVEVEVGGQWTSVEGLRIEPPMALDPSLDPGFEHRTLHFDPVHADAVRLIGTPGGVESYATCAELRVRMLDPTATAITEQDLTPLAQFSSTLDELGLAYAATFGSEDPDTATNGTEPPEGSLSQWAQLTTWRPSSSGEDWFALALDVPRTVQRVRFQEGLAQATGGWFDDLRLEYRPFVGAGWQPFPDALLQPSYRADGPGGTGYESFDFVAAPTVAADVRVIGAPGGSERFASVAELRVFGPAWDPQLCGVEPYGPPAGPDDLSLASATPPVPGAPLRFEFQGATPGTPTSLGLSLGSAAIDLGGVELLLDPALLTVFPVLTDASGFAAIEFLLPPANVIGGAGFFCQGADFDPFSPSPIRLSNALSVRVCPQ